MTEVQNKIQLLFTFTIEHCGLKMVDIQINKKHNASCISLN